MLASLHDIGKILPIAPKSVMHVGAHEAEERAAYEAAGVRAIAWVEANPLLVELLCGRVSASERVYEGAAWSAPNLELTLHVMSDSQASSLFSLQDHSRLYPSIEERRQILVRTVVLAAIWDDFFKETGFACDFLNLDIQGSEFQALQGLGATLSSFKWIYLELSTRPLYWGQHLEPSVHELLVDAGFHRVFVRRARGFGWGDGFYVSSEERRNVGEWVFWRARLLFALRFAQLDAALMFRRTLRTWLGYFPLYRGQG